MSRVKQKQSYERPVAGDLIVRGRVNELLGGRATQAELIAEGILVDLTTGPTAKAWSDAFPGRPGVCVTRGVWAIIQQAVQHPDSRTDLDTVVYDLLYMSQPSLEAFRLVVQVALTGKPFPYVDETHDAELDTRLMELRRRYPEERVFVCWIPTDPTSMFGHVSDTHIFRMVLCPGDDDELRFIIMMPDGG